MTRFVSVTNFPNLNPAARFYTDKELGRAFHSMVDPQDYFLDAYRILESKGHLSEFDFIASIVWGMGKDKMADFYAMSGLLENGKLKESRNPELNLWTMKNGVLVRGSRFHPRNSQACLESLTDISRIEREHLIGSPDFEHYKYSFPQEALATGKRYIVAYTTSNPKRP